MRFNKYNEFILNEASEFNLQRFNSDSVRPSTHVDDPTLSTNAINKNQDLIQQSMSRINDIMSSLKGSNIYQSLRRNLLLDDQDIKNLKILRILKNNGVIYTAYVTLTIGDQEYWGEVLDITGYNTEFKSELFHSADLYQPKEWVVKTKGIVIKTIKKWLMPERGSYKLLNDSAICSCVLSGNQLRLLKDAVVEVTSSSMNKIKLSYNDKQYNLTGDNFIYFNWWFEKID